MASPPVLTPGGTTGWNLQRWQKTFEFATYQEFVLIPLIDEGDGRLYGAYNVRKHARVGGTALGQSSDGDSLTASNIIASPIQVTPTGTYVYVAWSQNEEEQLDASLDEEGRKNIEKALAEATETNAAAIIPGLTQNLSQADVDGPLLRQAFGRLMTNTNGMFAPGDSIHGYFTTTQYPNIANISEFNSAQVRGDSENPYVKGVWTRGGGILMHFTTVVTNDVNGWNNALFHGSFAVAVWNTRSLIKRQDFLLQNRLICYNNVGFQVKNDLRAVGVRSTASAL